MAIAYSVGSVYIKEGTPAELGAFVQGIPYIVSTNYAYSGTTGSYVVFVEAKIDN